MRIRQWTPLTWLVLCGIGSTVHYCVFDRAMSTWEWMFLAVLVASVLGIVELVRSRLAARSAAAKR
ncbi:MAG: hypothetical protein QG608_3355 [Actinomycetota bacterium]|nr:hypothetical protein [Actinomycetota bacterium]